MNAAKSRLFCLALLPFLFAPAARPQQLSEAARTLVAIKVTGSKRFSQEAVIAASGLRTGTVVGDEDFKKAARRLGDTGAFSDIGYSFSYSGAGTKLEFQATDAVKFLPAHFEDFVWFPDEELLRRVKEHVPLFTGELPVSGRLPDDVSDVLQAMLVERGIPGLVSYIRFNQGDGPILSFNYSVAEVLIRIRNVEFTGAGAAELPLLQTASERIPDRQYSRIRFNTIVERQFLPVFRARGFLKATFGPPTPKVVKGETDEAADAPKNLTLVDVALTVTPGESYKISKVEWSGNKAIPTETLQTLVRARSGQTANMVQLGDDLASVKTLYGSKGYVNVNLKANAEFDEAADTVALTVDAKEDAIYHMGELEFRGIDNALTAKLRAAWKIRPGDVYDATYIKEYLPQALKLLPAALDWESAVHVTANVKDKSVDVDLIYTAKAPK